jgi:hypothetical protein
MIDTDVLENTPRGLPEVTEGHVTPSGFPWVCAYTTGSYAKSDLVGPFDRK